MPGELHEIIHSLNYQVNSDPLQKALDALQGQVRTIELLKTSLQRLQQQYAATTDPTRQQQLTVAIANAQRAIEAQTNSLRANIAANRQLHQAVEREAGLIGNLSNRLQRLQRDRTNATNLTDVRRLNQEIQQTQRQLDNLTGTGGRGGGAFATVGKALAAGLGIGGGIAAIGTVTNFVGDFIAKSSQLAKEAEGVERAFNNLNKPGLLENLRTATRGTVSDLELMKRAVAFSNFGLPVEKLGEAFAFARARARDTGQSVDYLVESISTGIGRQSPLILDNLGINAKRVRDEFKKCGDFAQAAFKIVNEEAAKAGDQMDTFADRMDRLNATIANSQAKFGRTVNNITSQLAAAGQDIFDTFTGGNPDALFDGSKTNLAQYQRSLEEKERLDEMSRLATIQANASYVNNFQRFQDDLARADYNGRERIIEQAKAANQTLINEAKEYAAQQGYDYETYLLSIAKQFQRFQESIKTVRPSLNSLDPSTFDQLSKDYLEEIIKRVGDARTPLRSTDTKEIERLNKLQEAAQKQLDIINGKQDKAAIKSAKTAETLAQRREKFELDLTKKIADLSDQQQQLRLKNEAETTAKIKMEVDSRLAKELQELAVLEQTAKAQNLLTTKARQQFAELRRLQSENAVISFNNQNDDLMRKFLSESAQQNINISRNNLTNREGFAALGQAPNLEGLRENISLERQVALAEEQKKFDDLKEQYRKENRSIDDIQRLHNENIELINLQFYQKDLAANLDYLEQLQKQITEATASELLAIDSLAAQSEDDLITRFQSGAISRRQFQRLQRFGQIRKEIDKAKAEVQKATREFEAAMSAFDLVKAENDAVYGNPGSTQQQKNISDDELQRAADKVNEARAKITLATNREIDSENSLRDAREESINAQIGFYLNLAATVASVYNQIADAQQRSLEREINVREERVRHAERLADRGNNEALRLEEERLRKAQQMREEYARRQQAVNAALAVSEAIVGVANAVSTGDPYTVAFRVIALLASLYAGYQAVTSATNQAAVQGFYKGGYTGDGNPTEEAGPVHKGEYVFDHKATKRIGVETLEALRAGAIPPPMIRPDLKLSTASGDGFATRSELAAQGKKLDRIAAGIEAIESPGINIDREGVAAISINHQARQRRMWGNG